MGQIDLIKTLINLCAVLALAACGPPAETGGSHSANRGPVYLAQTEVGACCTVIAHAGGGIDGNSYTNSIEAVSANYRLGTRYFEIDLSLSADGKWYGVHDWEHWQRHSGYTGPVPPVGEEVRNRKLELGGKGWSIRNEYTAVSLEWLNEFLVNHPDARVITDIKERKHLERLVSDVLELESAEQFVFQAYSIAHIDSIHKRAPEADIILTLYRMGWHTGIPELLAPYEGRLLGVTLPMNRAYDKEFLASIQKANLPLFLHGSPANINSRALHAYFAARGVSGFYLD